MFVDTAKVYIKAGKGGNGAVSFRHEIYIHSWSGIKSIKRIKQRSSFQQEILVVVTHRDTIQKPFIEVSRQQVHIVIVWNFFQVQQSCSNWFALVLNHFHNNTSR